MILDLSKCHDPGPDYLSALAYYEVSDISSLDISNRLNALFVLHYSLRFFVTRFIQ